MTAPARDERPPGAAAPPASLRVRGLRVATRSRQQPTVLLDGVDLDVAPGQVVGIVGESGSGKSTLCRAVARLLPGTLAVTAGSIGFGGRDLLGGPARHVHRIAPRGIGMVFQDPFAALNPVLTVGDQVEEAVRARAGGSRRTTRERALALLDQLGVPGGERTLRRHPHELSGGQRQRVVLAMALAGDPALLLADEPTSALDVRTQDEILRLLAELTVERDLALVLVSHDYAVVAQLCTSVVVLYAGRVLEQGPTQELLRRPRHPYTAGLVAALPSLERRSHRLTVIPGQPPSAAGGPGCPFRPRCAHALAACEATPPLVGLAGGRASACCRVHELWPAEPAPPGVGVRVR